MINSNHLSASIEAARLRFAEEAFALPCSEMEEKQRLLDEAFHFAPDMELHRLVNTGWIVTVVIDSFYRPGDRRSFKDLSLSLMEQAGMPTRKISDYVLFVKSNQTEEKVREEIILACLPF